LNHDVIVNVNVERMARRRASGYGY
jgi:hypothetical protein